MKVSSWPSDEIVKDLEAVLKMFDYYDSPDITSWKDLEKRMPVIFAPKYYCRL